MPKNRWSDRTGYPMVVAARILGIPKSELYGMVRVLGIKTTAPVASARKVGMPPRLVSAADMARIRKALKS